MNIVKIPRLGAAVLALALGCSVFAAHAADSPVAPAPTALSPRSLAARGPLALSLAAEPRAFHWAFETGFPLGLTRRDAAGRTQRNVGPWRLDAFMSASHDVSQPREVAANGAGLGYSLRLERANERNAFWLGVARGGSRTAGDPEARLRLAAGRVQALGAVRAEVSWVSSSVLFSNDPRWTHQRTFKYFAQGDTSQPGVFLDTTVTEPTNHLAIWNTAQGTLRWQRGRLALASTGGLSLGEGAHARRWAQGSLELQLSRRVLMLASLGERPAPSLAFNTDAHPRTMLGVQLAPWSAPGWAMSGALRPAATAWRTQTLEDDRLLVRVRCRNVSSAEMSGDFTDWMPVRLASVHAGWWAAVLHVPAGVHRVQLRFDGGPWLAPPGLPRADDGPGGASGTLLVAPSED